jgi:N-methylhydantoinase B
MDTRVKRKRAPRSEPKLRLDPVTIQLLWNRLISVVDEASSGLIRTAYTPSVKEYHDFCCAVFDVQARLLAHSTVTTPGLLGVIPDVMVNFVRMHPPESLKPGDVLITNDPWLASGHLIDVTVAAPVFHRGRLVAYVLCIVHHLDMGGRMATLESKDIYEEGLKIPILKLYRQGELNETVYEFIRSNTRVPEKILGDLRAQLIANNVCARGLLRLMEEYELDGIGDLADEIIERTESSLRRKIAQLPAGTYPYEVTLPPIPGCKERVHIKVAVTIDGDSITLDYRGSSGEVGAAVNCCLNMTKSYSSYPIKAALDPEVPSNHGALLPISVVADEGTVVHCRPPAATWGRTMISHLYPEIIFGALENVIPEYVLGGQGCCPANEVYLHGHRRDGRAFMAIANHMGGYGGSARQDGHSALCFPFNTRDIPIEVTEAEATILYVQKELVIDSAGPGKNRGGLGQVVEFEVLSGERAPAEGYVASSVRLSGRSEDSDFPVLGRLGGRNGRGYGLEVNGKAVEHGIYRRLYPGDRVRFQLSGGGGYGDPTAREPERVARDVAEGYVSVEGARADYGVCVDPSSFQVDRQKTAQVRKESI